jgi:hypothetical protein
MPNNSEPAKCGTLVRDDGVRRAGYRQFEEEFVSWVW